MIEHLAVSETSELCGHYFQNGDIVVVLGDEWIVSFEVFVLKTLDVC